MTIVYRCDTCGVVLDAVVSSGSSPLQGNSTVYVSWKVEKGKHLCPKCLAEWFRRESER